VLGVIGATLGASVALGLSRQQIVDALGNAGSLSSGIIEYLAEGAWTKRLHAGWAAQAGVQSARFGQQGFLGPRTVFEGTHGLFQAFAHSSRGAYDVLTEDFGRKWYIEGITFKPYATGTMNQPYIDCALRLAKRGFAAEEVAEVLCETAEGYVQRLWEPLAAKQAPPNAYAAKFSVPFNIAVAFVTGGAGLAAFSETTVKDPRVLALAARIRYAIDPTNPYPRGYTGHVRMRLRDGQVFEERQPHIRGGAAEPLSREEIEAKFHGNARHGGWSPALAEQFVECSRKIFDEKVDLSPFRR
jgi:2-methylcitrate dehydratase PrpD